MKSKIQISIIIIVKNDKGVIDTLDHLIKITKVQTVEIIVVDASTKDIGLDKIDKQIIKIVPYENQINKKITIPEQRNVGVKSAKGDIIVFIDANCIPGSNWLDNLVMHIINNEEYIVAGAILSLGENKYHDVRNKILNESKYLEEAPTMNLALRKEVFQNVGYFDESFEYGSDVDFTWRAIESGYKIRYQPTAILYHNWGTYNEEFKRAFRYGKARVDLFKKHRKSLFYILRNDPITIIYAFYIFFSPIVFIWPYYVLILLLLFLKNIAHNPIKTVLLNLAFGLGVLSRFLTKL